MRARTAPPALAALCLALPVAVGAVAVPAAPASAVTASSSSSSSSEGSLLVRELTGSDLRLHDLAPGDTLDWAAEVTNTTADGSPLSVHLDALGDRPLTADVRDGIQLEVSLCTAGYAPSSSPPLCRGPLRVLGSGPAATLGRLDTSIPLDAGATVGVGVRVLFPASAGNDLEDTDGAIRVTFSLLDDSPAPGGPGTDPGPGAGPPGAPAPDAGPVAAGGETRGPRAPLPVTGRDIASAVAGALIALATGGLLVLASRRRRAAEEAGS
ncbi:hypothetical protein QFZ62_002047 [Clavibacter sp. B3I6]|uniref:sortase n=1 Tax=Clavibacter sp. B3I6 TaxID=3042268 RepID=UPI00277EA3B9|nr:sortase [Clavibacter sp. B3I6]MDQ0744739.1 hypothetical protein [Clavibacter sp. B3I6]